MRSVLRVFEWCIALFLALQGLGGAVGSLLRYGVGPVALACALVGLGGAAWCRRLWRTRGGKTPVRTSDAAGY